MTDSQSKIEVSALTEYELQQLYKVKKIMSINIFLWVINMVRKYFRWLFCYFSLTTGFADRLVPVRSQRPHTVPEKHTDHLSGTWQSAGCGLVGPTGMCLFFFHWSYNLLVLYSYTTALFPDLWAKAHILLFLSKKEMNTNQCKPPNKNVKKVDTQVKYVPSAIYRRPFNYPCRHNCTVKTNTAYTVISIKLI